MDDRMFLKELCSKYKKGSDNTKLRMIKAFLNMEAIEFGDLLGVSASSVYRYTKKEPEGIPSDLVSRIENMSFNGNFILELNKNYKYLPDKTKLKIIIAAWSFDNSDIANIFGKSVNTIYGWTSKRSNQIPNEIIDFLQNLLVSDV